MQIGDCVTILRDGKFVASAAVKDIDVSWIVKKMVGAKIGLINGTSMAGGIGTIGGEILTEET